MLSFSWYRGQIIGATTEDYEVYFGDYGDVEWISKSNAAPLPESLLEVRIGTCCKEISFGLSKFYCSLLFKQSCVLSVIIKVS